MHPRTSKFQLARKLIPPFLLACSKAIEFLPLVTVVFRRGRTPDSEPVRQPFFLFSERLSDLNYILFKLPQTALKAGQFRLLFDKPLYSRGMICLNTHELVGKPVYAT